MIAPLPLARPFAVALALFLAHAFPAPAQILALLGAHAPIPLLGFADALLFLGREFAELLLAPAHALAIRRFTLAPAGFPACPCLFTRLLALAPALFVLTVFVAFLAARLRGQCGKQQQPCQ